MHKNIEKNQDGIREESRREFIKSVGKLAVYAPPVVTVFAYPSLSAMANSAGGSGGGGGYPIGGGGPTGGGGGTPPTGGGGPPTGGGGIPSGGGPEPGGTQNSGTMGDMYVDGPYRHTDNIRWRDRGTRRFQYTPDKQ